MNVKHTSEIAGHLRDLADKIEKLDAELPADRSHLDLTLWMFRKAGDGHTNRAAMEFADRYADAIGLKPCSLDNNSYRSDGANDKVYVFPLAAAPKPPLFDPEI